MTDAMDRGRFSKPVRKGNVVERALGPGRANVHALLTYLDKRGFHLAPRAVRRLHDASGGFVAPEPDRWSGHDYAGPVQPDCIGHLDLAPWNIAFDGERVTGIIDWDFAAPTSRAWDLAYAAHQFVPFHPTDALPAWGWNTEPDRPARLRLFAEAYGPLVTAAQLVDVAAMRLLSIGAHIEERIRADDPAFAIHRDEDHASGYRAAAGWILTHRAELLG